MHKNFQFKSATATLISLLKIKKKGFNSAIIKDRDKG